jgi:hypothetical protein
LEPIKFANVKHKLLSVHLEKTYAQAGIMEAALVLVWKGQVSAAAAEAAVAAASGVASTSAAVRSHAPDVLNVVSLTPKNAITQVAFDARILCPCALLCCCIRKYFHLDALSLFSSFA